jgi:hypothetical protein
LLLRELLIIDIRYAVILMKIKKRSVANIEKERRIILIVAEFHIKLIVCNYIRNFLLIKFPFILEIIIFVLRIRYDFERII